MADTTGNVTQYIGARYVPLFVGEWDNKKEYEPLSIVQYKGNSYTSRQFVPKNIEITNDVYWAVTGDYNAQVEAYRQDVVHEAKTRTDADTVLQGNIDAEAKTRADTDTVLQGNINAEAKTRTDADNDITKSINEEAIRAVKVENELKSSIDENTSKIAINTSKIAINSSDIDTETKTRAHADTTLQNNIDTEANARENADTTFQNNIKILGGIAPVVGFNPYFSGTFTLESGHNMQGACESDNYVFIYTYNDTTKEGIIYRIDKSNNNITSNKYNGTTQHSCITYYNGYVYLSGGAIINANSLAIEASTHSMVGSAISYFDNKFYTMQWDPSSALKLGYIHIYDTNYNIIKDVKLPDIWYKDNTTYGSFIPQGFSTDGNYIFLCTCDSIITINMYGEYIGETKLTFPEYLYEHAHSRYEFEDCQYLNEAGRLHIYMTDHQLNCIIGIETSAFSFKAENNFKYNISQTSNSISIIQNNTIYNTSILGYSMTGILYKNIVPMIKVDNDITITLPDFIQNKNIMFSGSGIININNTSQIQTYNCNIQGGVWNCNNEIYMFINNTKIRTVQINNNYSKYRFSNVTGTLRLLTSNGLYVNHGSLLNVNFNNVTNLENTNDKGLITYNGQII